MIKVRHERVTCEPELLAKVQKLGFELTQGCTTSLERILLQRGFGLPIYVDEWGYNFMINYKWIRFYLNYADALANEILLLNELKLL